MERRGFLRGLFGGVVGAGIVVTASPEEVAQFASPLAPDMPMVVDAPAVNPVGCGDHLYNERGELVAIVTNLQNVFRKDFIITAQGVGEIHLGSDRVRLRNERRS